VAPKFSTTMCTMGEITTTNYIERESYGTLLTILHLDFYFWSFYAFHRRSHLLNYVHLRQLIFPSLHALKRSLSIVFINSTGDFLLYNLYILSALSFIWEHFFSLHLLSHYSTSLDPTGTLAQSSCALVQFMFSRFRSIPCLCLTIAHLVTTPIQVKIRCQSLSPYCISLPLSRSSSILPLRNHSHRI